MSRMDESFCIAGSQFPDGEPDGGWTVEELIHWAHAQYRAKAIDRTSRAIDALRDQCDKECDEVMKLHALAVEMAKKRGGGDGAGGEENVDPQSSVGAGAPAGEGRAAKPTSFSSTAANAGGSSPPPSAIEVRMTVGPHSSSSWVLRPRPGAPCLLGRSKGKKFTRGHGVSMYKDQEVSTTHGKFVVEMGLGAEGEGPKFYFIDVGSTNGTLCKGDQLEPNKPLLLEDGMELKVGNSAFKVFLV